jgi:AcrR family transcriptional regulator
METDLEIQSRGVRQQRADETRARLFAAAVELFKKHGYHATTVDRIAAHAGVAKGTFFVHFPSKDAVISELVRMQTDAARAARATALGSGKGPIEAMRAAVLTLAEYASKSRSISRGVLAASVDSQDAGGQASTLFDEVFGDMRVDAEAAKKAGLLLPHVDPSTLAAQLMASYLGAVLHFASSPKAKPLMEIVAPLVDASVAGALRTFPARRRERAARSTAGDLARTRRSPRK